MSLPTDKQARKDCPIATGFLDYFPDAAAEVARVSKIGNDQHNPGEPLHWAREKSDDHPDCLIRHFMERGTVDTDGTRHSAKMVWRALAILQLEIEASRQTEGIDMKDPINLTFLEQLKSGKLILQSARPARLSLSEDGKIILEAL